MSARSVAEHALTVYFGDSEDPAGMARKVLDNYAHELAESQRKHDESEPIDYRKPQAWRDGYSDGIQEAADLIDPEKQS